MTSSVSDSPTSSSSPASPRRWCLVIHGGAGAISREFDPERKEYLATLRRSLQAGQDILLKGGDCVSACVEAVRIMEECPLYNAGIGSVFTADGTHELDAAVMRGRDRAAGAVAGVRTVRNPVLLAEQVMLHSPHVLLIADGAEKFAVNRGFEPVENTIFDTDARKKIHVELLKQAAAAASATSPSSSGGVAPLPAPVLDHTAEAAAAKALLAEDHAREKKYGTVGAVALDLEGNLGVAISTGGMSMKSFGRVGDSPVIGSGFYATKEAAVCCTGNGEAFMRMAVAKDVVARMEYGGASLADAADAAIALGESTLGKEAFEGGLVAVDKQGNFTMPYNSKGMYRGVVGSNQEAMVAVWRD